MLWCEYLVNAMDASGKTLEEIVGISRVSKSTLLRYRGGKTRNPKPREVQDLATALGLDTNKLRASIIRAYEVRQAYEARKGAVEEEDVNRRSFLKVAASSVVLTPFATQVGMLVQPAIRHVGQEDVDGLMRLRKTLVGSDSVLGARPVMQSVIEQVGRVDNMLRHADSLIRLRLFEVGAMFCEFAGWLADDLGDTSVGGWWSGRALDWAHASGNEGIVAYVLQRKAQQAVLVGDGVLAAALASSIPTRRVPFRVQAAAKQQLAHGLAMLGDEKGSLAALDCAAELLLQLNDDEPSPFRLASWCTPTYLEAQRGACLTKVGRPLEAVAAFDAALSVWPETYRRERGLHLARKSVAMANAGEFDGAVVAGREAIAVLATAYSSRATDELRKVDLAFANVGICDAGIAEFRYDLAQLPT